MSDLFLYVELGYLATSGFLFFCLMVLFFGSLLFCSKRFFSGDDSKEILLAPILVLAFIVFIYSLAGMNCTESNLLTRYENGEYSKEKLNEILAVYAEIEAIGGDKAMTLKEQSIERQRHRDEFNKLLSENRDKIRDKEQK